MALESNDFFREELPNGNYKLVGIDIDTTGRRLIDEIVQLSAYTPDSQFNQYIMPIMNLNPAARQRHQLRVITIGFFRMLKSMQTYKVVKTRSEILVLKEFLDWIEQIRGPDSDGIIFIYHEQRKFLPYMLLEAMKKYDLLDRFLTTVKSFANSYIMAGSKCANETKYLSLRQLSKVLLGKVDVDETARDRDTFEGSAGIRAKLAYEIVENLTKDGVVQEEENTPTPTPTMEQFVKQYASSIKTELNELDDENKCINRQNSLRPVFVNYFKTTLYHRVKAVTFRRVLAGNGYDYEQLKELWISNKKSAIEEAVSSMEELKLDDRIELINLLDHHYDPEKQPVQPIVKRNKRRPSRRGAPSRDRNQIGDDVTNSNKPGGSGGGPPHSPDSTHPTTPKRNNGNNHNQTNSGGGNRRYRRSSPRKGSPNKQTASGSVAANELSNIEGMTTIPSPHQMPTTSAILVATN